MTLAADMSAAGVAAGRALALAVVPGAGLVLAWTGGQLRLPTVDPATVVGELAALDPRWTWWSAWETAAPLVAAGVRPRTCWDIGAAGRLLHGLRRNDPAAVWAAEHGLAEPSAPAGGLDLFDRQAEGDGPVRGDGQLSRLWLDGAWADDLDAALRWAGLALQAQRSQEAALRALPDPRPDPRAPTLALLTAWAESAAALLAVELSHDGLPLDREAASGLLRAAIGEPPADAAGEAAVRSARDAAVLRHFPGQQADLRNPAQVRDLLARIGFDLPDTRSWRLQPHAGTNDAVAALLAWRKAERITTTYGWRWLARHVGEDGRLRGAWNASDGGAGRMTAGAALHNLPAEFRPAVRAEEGHLFVRADLGQVEPRVLAAVSGDQGLARAAREDDMYAPVAAALGCDRPTAKVAVLAAMYGQTSGPAGAALRDMDRAYPRAMAYLRAAEEAGRTGRDLRTYGGRLIRLTHPDPGAAPGYGRYARNAVIQGAAAELFKAWAATVRDGLAAVGGQIVLCLHDELLLHVPADRVPAAETAVRTALAGTTRWWAAGSPVRFVVDVATGASWADAH
ncbi:MAG: DNA polymerase [Pseudonocardiales bacterium]